MNRLTITALIPALLASGCFLDEKFRGTANISNRDMATGMPPSSVGDMDGDMAPTGDMDQTGGVLPSAPIMVTASSGIGSATVSWGAPVSSGASSIVGYTVTSSPDGVTATTAGNTTMAQVTGLTNGTSYTFTVTATNSNGTGPASSPSNSVTPVVAAMKPAAPTNATAALGGDKAIKVSWTAADNRGSPISYYTVTATDGSQSAQTKDGTTLSATLSGLTAGKSYQFTVTATNGVGSGPASDPSNSVIAIAAPSVPSGVAVCPQSDAARVTFGAATGAVSYNVYYGTSSNVGPGHGNVLMLGDTLGEVNGLTQGTMYYFAVTAVNQAGESAPSTAVSATPTAGVHDLLVCPLTNSGTTGSALLVDCFSTIASGTTPRPRQINWTVNSFAKVVYPSIAVDATSGALYVAHGTQVDVFSDASTVDQNATPVRSLQGPKTTFPTYGEMTGLAVDTRAGRDRAYVVPFSGTVLVFANASTFNGDQAPAATISAPSGLFSGSPVINTSNEDLYVANSTTNVIDVFANANQASGSVTTVSKTWAVSGASSYSAVFMDSSTNILYLSSASTLYSIPNPGTVAGGTVTSPTALAPTDRPSFTPTAVVANKVYGLTGNSQTGRQFSIWNNASTATGNAGPSKTNMGLGGCSYSNIYIP